MKIFIELPTWLGDTVMCTGAISNIVKNYPNSTIVLFGSFVSIQVLKNLPNLDKVVIDNSKKGGNRYINLVKIAKNLGYFDIAISFRRTFSSKFLLFFIKSNQKYSYKRYTKKHIHQVVRYDDFINRSLNIKNDNLKLVLYSKAHIYKKKTLGLNPGSTYGSAKRWYAKEFAQSAIFLSKYYDIVIFGSSNEKKIANDICSILDENLVKNYSNEVGKTTISELISKIAGLDLFITNDSGSMHIAAAYKIKSVCIFGPTNYIETCQFDNENSIILTKNLSCAPCMKRVCPLIHHNCMKQITSNDLLKALGYENVK